MSKEIKENFAKFFVEPFEISKMLENSIFDDDQELQTKNRVLDDSLNSDNLVNYSNFSKEKESKMKKFEKYNDLKVKPNCYFIARLDGKGFSKLTKEMKLKKPFDNNMHIAIVKAIKKLMFETGAIAGYAESDEISILFDKDSSFFDRRIEKINSVLASMMTGFCMQNEFFKDFSPIFDCRILVTQTNKEVFNIFQWRQWDSLRNCLNSYAYWNLRFSGKTKRQSECILRGMRGDAKQELLLKEFNIDLNKISSWEKYGTYVFLEKYEKEGFNPKENFEFPNFSKFSEKNFAQISFGNSNYAKFSKEKKKVLAIRRRYKEVSKEFKNSNEFFKELNKGIKLK